MLSVRDVNGSNVEVQLTAATHSLKLTELTDWRDQTGNAASSCRQHHHETETEILLNVGKSNYFLNGFV